MPLEDQQVAFLKARTERINLENEREKLRLDTIKKLLESQDPMDRKLAADLLG